MELAMMTACCETAPTRQNRSTPTNRPTPSSKQTGTICQLAAPAVDEWIDALCRIACDSNKGAKEAKSAEEQAWYYARKNDAISSLLILGGANVVEISLWQGLVTVLFKNRCCEHAPITELSQEAQEIVLEVLWRFTQDRTRRTAA